MFEAARQKFLEWVEWCKKDGMTDDDIDELIEEERDQYDA